LTAFQHAWEPWLAKLNSTAPGGSQKLGTVSAVNKYSECDFFDIGLFAQGKFLVIPMNLRWEGHLSLWDSDLLASGNRVTRPSSITDHHTNIASKVFVVFWGFGRHTTKTIFLGFVGLGAGYPFRSKQTFSWRTPPDPKGTPDGEIYHILYLILI